MTEPIPEPHTHGGNGSPLGALTKKVGPLPGYAWVLIAVGLYVGYRYYKARSGAPAITSAGAQVASTAPDPVTGGSSAAGGLVGAGGTVTTPNGSTQPQSNASWVKTAADFLIGKGMDPSLVETALSNYANGIAVDPSQQSIVNQALTAFGSPPEGVLPVTTTPAPTPTPTTTYTTTDPPPGTKWVRDASANNGLGQLYQDWPDGSSHALTNPQYAAYTAKHGVPTWTTVNAKPAAKAPTPAPKAPTPAPKPTPSHLYVVKSGDTLSSISRQFYGSTSGVSKIYNANRNVIGPNENLIKPGQRLTIPA